MKRVGLVNEWTKRINQQTRDLYTGLSNSGDNPHVYLRDIELWSKLFNSNEKCMAADGVHVNCLIFKDMYIGWFLNYVEGNLLLNAHNPSTINF